MKNGNGGRGGKGLAGGRERAGGRRGKAGQEMASELDMGQRKVLMRMGTSRDKYPKAVHT
jgi:hypothetical protein